MEPNAAKMISYEDFFKIVDRVKQKVTVGVFHFNRCEDLQVYADTNMTYVLVISSKLCLS